MKNIRKHFIVLVALLMCGCTQYVIKHGEGVLTSSNGDMFEGVLKDGKPLSGSLYDKQGFEKEPLVFDTTDIKKGVSFGLSGCGICSSIAFINSSIEFFPVSSSFPSRAAKAEPCIIGILSPG